MRNFRIITMLFVLVCVHSGNTKVACALDHATIKSYATGSFSTSWTHSINTPAGILWYNSQTGAGAVGKIDNTGNHTSIKTLSFSAGWTHVISLSDRILWYNAKTGSGAIGTIDNSGNHSTSKSFPGGYFSTGWTNIVNTPEGILWYNAKTGAAAVGRLQ